jgi:hypothetical protein
LLKPARATPTMISKAWACLRTSIFVPPSDARTNARVDLMVSRHCTLASPGQLASRLMRAQQCKRLKRLMESVSSFGTSRSEVACGVQPKRGVADRSLSFKSGRSESKIGPYSQLRGQFVGRRQSGNGRRADRRERSMCGVSRRCDGRFDLGQWVRFAQNILPAARCIRATLFGIIDDLQFLPLCAHILIPTISAIA